MRAYSLSRILTSSLIIFLNSSDTSEGELRIQDVPFSDWVMRFKFWGPLPKTSQSGKWRRVVSIWTGVQISWDTAHRVLGAISLLASQDDTATKVSSVFERVAGLPFSKTRNVFKGAFTTVISVLSNGQLCCSSMTGVKMVASARKGFSPYCIGKVVSKDCTNLPFVMSPTACKQRSYSVSSAVKPASAILFLSVSVVSLCPEAIMTRSVLMRLCVIQAQGVI